MNRPTPQFLAPARRSQKPTTSAHHGWQTSLISGFFCFVLILGISLLQATHASAAALDLHDWLRVVATGFVLGLLPATLLAHASGWLGRRALSPRVASLLFWLPTAAICAAYAGLSVLGESAEFGADTAVLLVAGAGLSAVIWRFRDASTPAPAEMAPVALAWVALTFLLIKSAASDPGHPTLAYQSALLVAFIAPPLLLAAAWWNDLWGGQNSPRPSPPAGRIAPRVRTPLLATGLLGGLGLIFWVHTLFIGIYLPLKAWLSINILLGLWLLCAPFYPRWARRAGRWIWALVALSILGAAATCWLILAPIPQRFGAFPARSMVGLAVRSLSFMHDADADGFYAQSAGGNDCDDADPEVHPAALIASKNCWALNTDLPIASPKSAPQALAKAPAPFASEHIIIYISDAVRADVLYGAGAAQDFPNLSQFGRDALRFERAYAPGNSTVQSLLPMLSGVSPIHALGATSYEKPMPLAQMLTARSIFELAPDEFCNVMITYSHKPEPWIVEQASAHLDIARSETTVDLNSHTTPPAVDAFEEALDHCQGRRLMAVLYSDDPHRDDVRGGYTCADGSIGGKACYLEAIGVVDREFGRLRAMLQARGILKNALFVMTSDHGEAFGEHGHTTHSSSVFDEQIRVPLLVHLPGAPPARIKTPVSLLGLKATVAETAGLRLKHPPAYPSWMELFADPAASYPAPISQNWLGALNRFWTAPSSAFIAGEDKLIYDWKTGFVRLYHLADDPEETRNLARIQPEKTAALLAQFKAEQAARLIHYAWPTPAP